MNLTTRIEEAVEEFKRLKNKEGEFTEEETRTILEMMNSVE